jgi:hypothetical protein
MPLPPKGDPTRPLHLAIRSTRLLGIFFLLIGMLAMLPFMLAMRRSGLTAAWLPLSIGGCYLVPGVMYLICGIFLGQKRGWAVILGIVLASLHAIMTLLLIGSIFGQLGSIPGRSDSPMLIIISAIFLLILAALGQMIYHLAKSFESIRVYDAQTLRGFEPLRVQPIQQDSDATPR